jgi:hypothetical protein
MDEIEKMEMPKQRESGILWRMIFLVSIFSMVCMTKSWFFLAIKSLMFFMGSGSNLDSLGLMALS